MFWAEGARAFQHKHIVVSCLTSHSTGSCLVPVIPENNSGFSQQASGRRHPSHMLNKSHQPYSEDLTIMHQAWSVSWQSRLQVLLVEDLLASF